MGSIFVGVGFSIDRFFFFCFFLIRFFVCSRCVDATNQICINTHSSLFCYSFSLCKDRRLRTNTLCCTSTCVLLSRGNTVKRYIMSFLFFFWLLFARFFFFFFFIKKKKIDDHMAYLVRFCTKRFGAKVYRKKKKIRRQE